MSEPCVCVLLANHVGHLDIGAPVQQQLNDLDVAVLRGKTKDTEAFLCGTRRARARAALWVVSKACRLETAARHHSHEYASRLECIAAAAPVGVGGGGASPSKPKQRSAIFARHSEHVLRTNHRAVESVDISEPVQQQLDDLDVAVVRGFH